MRETMNDSREGIEIDLQKLLAAFLHKWWLIVGVTALAALLTLVFTVHFVTPMYRASVTVYVNNIRSDQQVEYITSSNLATAQKLVNTYVNIIKSDTVLAKVAEKSHLDISADQIRKIMSAAQVEDTEIFTVSISHPDPELAAQIANTVAEVAPAEISNIVEGSSTKIIDYAKAPEKPVSPNVSRNTVLGGVIGCLLALLYVTLRFLMDVRIKDEEDLLMLFDLPVLGRIPTFEQDEKKQNSGKAGYGYDNAVTRGGAKQ